MRSKFLKNLQWKKKLKRLGALGLCALLIAGNLTIPDVAKAASPGATYPGPDSDRSETAIENALTYFQYFTSGDCTIGQHTVGAIAVGGTFTQTANTFGDGAQTASYANRIAFAKAPNLASGFRGVCNDVYYATTAMSGNQLAGFTQNPGYMDIPEIFSNISTESNEMANSGTQIVYESIENRTEGTVTGKVIVVDFTGENGANGYTIPYEVLKNADFIDVRLNNISDLISKKCVINITGMDDVTDMFEMYGSSNAGGVSNNQLKVGVLFNGKAESAIKDMASDPAYNSLGGQVFLNGMKLIFNLPDYAGTLRTECFEGHIVAPNAKVIPGGGNMQGGVVAKEVFVAESNINAQSAQAHYYPYNEPKEHYGCTSANASGDVCDSIIVNKVYKNGENIVPIDQCPPLGQGAKFTLYKWEDGQRGDAVVENIEAELHGDVHQVHILGTHLEKGKKYELVEISAAQGYDLSNTSIFCTVKEQDVYYSTNSNDPGNLTIPTLENIKSATPKGLIEVTVQEEGSTEKVPDIAVTISKDGTEYTLYTKEDGKVVFTNLDAGEYEVSIPAENTGYELITDDSNEATVTVVENQTVTHTFTLTKVAQQPVTGSITVTVKENSAEGQGMDGVSVTVKSKDDSFVTRSTENGTVTFDNLPLGTYTVSTAGKSGYTVKDSDTAEVSLTEAEKDKTHEFILQQLANITVNVTCGDSGVDGVTVQVTKGEDSPVSHQTVGGGKVSLPGVEPDTYKVQITAPPGYTIDGDDTQYDSVPAGGNVTFNFALEEEVQTPTTGTINVVVKDTDNAPVGGVSVQVKNSQDVGVNLNAPQTDATGVTGKDNLSPDTYTVEITPPEGYVCEGPKEQTYYVDADSVVDYVFTLAKCEDLKVVVIDTTTGEEVTGESGVTVSSGNNEVASSTFTGNDTFEDIKEGEYTVELTSYPNGYAVQGEDSKTVTIDADDDITEPKVTFYLVPTGKITVTVKNDSDADMNNVTVTLKSGDTVITSKDTVNGQVVFDSLGDKTYTVEIEDVAGYEIKSKTPDSYIVISGGNEATCDFVLAQTQPETAGIKVIVKDKRGNLIKDVQVTVSEKSTVVNYPVRVEGTTNDEGVLEGAGLNTAYDHLVKIEVPTGYLSESGYTDASATVTKAELTPGGTAVCEFTIVKTASLKINVIDTSTGEAYAKSVGVDVRNNETGVTKELNNLKAGNNDEVLVSEGEYYLYLRQYELWPNKYASADCEETITIDPYDKSSYEVTFYVSPSGTINVTVNKDGDPVNKQDVEIWCEDQNGDYVMVFSGKTQNDGKQEFTNVPSGDYEVRLLEDGVNNSTIIKTQTGTLNAGETDQVTFNLSDPADSEKGNIRISVKNDRYPAENLNRVEITVKNEEGTRERTYLSSGEGEVVITGLEPGNYTVTVEDLDNYVRTDSEVSTKEVKAGEDTKFNFVFSKRCKIAVKVVDQTTGTDVPIASPKISLSKGLETIGTQTSTESAVFEKLAAGTYEATVQAPAGYVFTDGKDSKEYLVAPYSNGTHTEPHEIVFYVVKCGTITVNVNETGENAKPVKNVPVTLQVKGNNDTYSDYVTGKATAENGTVTFKNVPLGDYKVIILDENSGYKKLENGTNEKLVSITQDDEAGNAQFYLERYAAVQVTIFDDTTEAYIVQDVQVAAYYEGQEEGSPIVVEGGQCSIPNLTAGNYVTKLTVPNGYVLSSGSESKTITIDPDTIPEDGIYKVQFNVTKRATLTVTVVDRDNNNNGVEGVEVQVPNAQGGTDTKTTDANGQIEIEGLPFGDYSTKITVPDGYKLVSPTTTEQGTTLNANNNSEELRYELCQVGSLTVTVVEKGTTTPVMGVNVTVTNKDDNTETYNLTTNTMNNGVLAFNGLEPGTYIVVSMKDVTGYKTLTDAERECEITVPGKEQKTHTFEYEPRTGELIITVRDEKTNNPVPRAKVKITKPAPANGASNQGESEIKETDNKGQIVMRGLPGGAYKTEIIGVPEGYNVTTNRVVDVTVNPDSNQPAQVDYKVGQVGALKVTITEKGTTNGIYGVQVAITTNASGTENTVYTYTDANGQVNIGGQKVGSYKISIPTSIAGYKELDAAYVVQTKDVEANKTTEYAFEVEKLTTTDPSKGEAEIIVKDEVTGNPVPGASVIVTAPDNTKRKYTTDGNGRITIPQQNPGDYKVEVIEVPEGYTVTQNKQTTITVVAGATVKAEIMVKPAEGNSGAGGSEVAPPTVGSGQGEADTTPDNNGGAVNTGGTSNNTGEVVNTGGTTDSVTNSGQTDGATNNKTTDSQSVSKQPKTGDETNPGIIWIILSVSACLAAASVIGLVYVKKKED